MDIKRQLLIGVTILGLASCSKDTEDFNFLPSEQPDTEQPGSSSSEDPLPTVSRNEKYRPQVHFTPAQNWMNDPNGMVYADGVWHLYYQYNPSGNDWGNMSWGHATSSDLMHWQEQPVAMIRNQWGDIFSGSAVVDKNNVAGFGAGTIIAFYTASGSHQQQCMAYSTDGGKSFTQYDGNPIISNNSLPDFRDPKVFYHEESGKWIMCLAMGWSCQVELWGSENLKNWTKLSTFSVPYSGSNIGQWECPDLVKLPYNGSEKWVLILSNNPGGPAGGSGTEYFVGDFNGTEFIADELDYPLWLDYGSDNYAGVTWSNAPGDRVIMIGWMNNWNYAGAVPCNPWRSAMTLPRELSLKEVNGSPLLSTKVVSEIDGIAGEWKNAQDGVCFGGDAYEIVVKVDMQSTSTFRIGNGDNEYMEVQVMPSADRIIAKRNSLTGVVGFNNLFSLPSVTAPVHEKSDELELHIYTDKSSVEIISADGTIALTNLVFPTSVYDRIIGLDGVSYRPLKSVW